MAIRAEFENREDGRLWGKIEGKPNFVPVATAVTPYAVFCDERRQLWSLGLRAVDYDGNSVTFRLGARDFFGLAVGRVEQQFARHGLIVERLSMLIAFLRQNLPDAEPEIVDDLRFEDDGNANRFFRSEFLRQRKAKIGRNFCYLRKPDQMIST